MGAVIDQSVRAVVIAGPTASGKSALAVALAERFGGVVINADSMQVYRDLRILTARPTDDELARAPHRLFGHVDAADPYSVGRWLRDIEDALATARGAGELPIVVGGTGLYLKALTQGLSSIPDVPAEVRIRIRAEAEGRPPSELHAALAAVDPAIAARLRPSDPQRIVRALEVFAATGRSLASYQDSRDPALLAGPGIVTVRLDGPRDDLRAAIDKRFDAMMEDGALDEVDHLAGRRLDLALPAMRALGVPPLRDHLEGRSTRAEAVERGKAMTRAYAKRQITFFRHQLPAFTPLARGEAVAALSARLEGR